MRRLGGESKERDGERGGRVRKEMETEGGESKERDGDRGRGE